MSKEMIRKKVPMSELKLAEKNVRLHSQTQLKEFVRSIEMFGQYRPIVVDENGTILAGNGLYMALEQSGYTEADVLQYMNLTNDEKGKLMIVDNKIYDLGQTSHADVMDILEGLETDLDVPGFDEDTLKLMLGDVEQIQDSLSQYGMIDEESKDRIQRNAQRKEDNIRKFAEERGAEYVPSDQFAGGATPLTDRKSDAKFENEEERLQKQQDKAVGEGKLFVTCPGCGEKIWL